MANLHSEINELIEKRLRRALETGVPVDVTEWISEFAESLADLVVFGAMNDDRERLIDHALNRLQYFIRQKERMFEDLTGQARQ
jgi:hypothetical protein